MKKLALFCAVVAMTVGVIADNSDGVKFKFSSSGDTYADGTAVQDGEVYALVWTKTGLFAGFNEDGSLADSANSDVMVMRAAKNGGCPVSVFIFNETHDGGFYQMYLLDTRAYSSEGVAGAPVGSADGKTLTSVKGFTAVESARFTAAEAKVADVAETSVDGSVGAQIPADVRQPVVTDIAFEGGTVKLTVAETVPYVQYTVKGGKNPAVIDDVVGNFLNGNAGKTIELTVANPGEYRFFKVVNK